MTTWRAFPRKDFQVYLERGSKLFQDQIGKLKWLDYIFSTEIPESDGIILSQPWPKCQAMPEKISLKYLQNCLKTLLTSVRNMTSEEFIFPTSQLKRWSIQGWSDHSSGKHLGLESVETQTYPDPQVINGKGPSHFPISRFLTSTLALSKWAYDSRKYLWVGDWFFWIDLKN